MRIEWTPRAHANLTAIRGYIAQDSPQAAESLPMRLLREAARLEDFPRMGGIVPEFGEADVREIIVGSYRVIYHVTATHVRVVAVRHGSRRLRRSDVPELD